jgi:cytochrome c biogenesis protein CcmG/thiol:disulfide interchange protein DsbE
MNVKGWLPFAVFLALGALLAAGVWMSKRADRDALPSPLICQKAPDFALKNLYNHEQSQT